MVERRRRGIASSRPLFCHPDGTSLTVDQVRDFVKRLMAAAGRDPALYGAHSLRIGGATAALAAGLSPASIRAAGRWSSEIYQIYCRLSRQSAVGVATTIGSTPFEDLERGVSFVDEELMLTVDEMPYLAASDFVERDLLEDAWDGEDEA